MKGDIGKFSTPDYPKKLPMETVCKWKISTDIGKLIELFVIDLKSNDMESCQNSGLQVSNSPNFQNDTIIGSYCGQIRNSFNVLSHSHEVYVKFENHGNWISSIITDSVLDVHYSTVDNSMYINFYLLYLKVLLYNILLKLKLHEHIK